MMMFKIILIIIFYLFNDNNNIIIKVRKNLPDGFKYFKSSFHILIVNLIIFYLEKVIILTYI